MDKYQDIKKTIENYDLLICDLDGTLVNLNVDWEQLKEDIHNLCKKETNKSVDSNSINEMIKIIKKNFDQNLYKESMTLIENAELNENKYVINNTLVDLIRSLPNKKIAMYSMNTRKCVNNFVNKYLKMKVELVVAKEDATIPKPTDEGILAIIKKTGMTKKQTIMIGNHELDKLSAQQAGINYILISNLVIPLDSGIQKI